ncbi:sulfatase [Halovenus sp. HT40]|uniref:sulfatase n=1 Tax=Halovenus sp. HT40 TaxID=3126691 RepID=UPI00300EFF03
MSDHPNVVVLIFDTLRYDYLSCYGNNIHTPAFDEVANSGVLFESAFACGPGTPISHAALYSGQYPSGNGVTENGVTGQHIPLPDDIPLITTWLSDRDYDTFGITGPAKMGSDWGYDRGFDELYEHYYEFPSLTSPRAILKSLKDPKFGKYFFRQLTKGGADSTRFKFDLLQDRIESRLDNPFYALVNFTTVHGPYDPPRPYKEQATPGFSRPRWNFLEYLADNRGKIDNPNVRLDRVMNAQTSDGIGKFLADPSYLNDAEIKVLRDWYTACVEYLNDEFKSFLDFYKRELQEDTILILTADHGEQFGEHDLLVHSHYLFDETLQVPLLMMGPGIPEGVRRTDLVSLVDLFDTICDLCKLDQPYSTSGQSMFGGDERDAVFMEYGTRNVDYFKKSEYARYLSDEQLLQFSAGRKGIRTDKYLFTITSNDTERLYENPEQNKIENPPENIVQPLRERLVNTLSEEFNMWPEGDSDRMRVDTQVEQNLRQLGYID